MATPRRRRRNFDHEEAVKAREQAAAVIDAIPPEDLVYAIKRAPSLRGMISGYIAEEMFERHVRDSLGIEAVEKHDDHDRSTNKSDRTLTVKGRRYTFQLKSIQTNSIHMCNDRKCLIADVQNDASDRREIELPNGDVISTTCYAVGEFDILAVPLFPFTGKWNYAYKLNNDCRRTASAKYSDQAKVFLLATTERICYPLDDEWSEDIFSVLERAEGAPASAVSDDTEEVSDYELAKRGLKVIED